jgi:hypothetical protein
MQNPKSETGNEKPKTGNPKHKTRYTFVISRDETKMVKLYLNGFELQTPNTYTLYQHPYTPNPQFYSLNPTTKPPNHKPAEQALNEKIDPS